MEQAKNWWNWRHLKGKYFQGQQNHDTFRDDMRQDLRSPANPWGDPGSV